jgi:hypothetical protein
MTKIHRHAYSSVVFALLCLSTAARGQAPNQLQIQASPPPSTNIVGVFATANLNGPVLMYYWVVARFPAGAAVSTPGLVFTLGPQAYDLTHFVTISWQSVQFATGYDVIRNTTQNYPGVSCAACAVAVNTTNLSINDIGSLGSYTQPTSGGNALLTWTLNNTTEANPFIRTQLSGVNGSFTYRLLPYSGAKPVPGNCPQFGPLDTNTLVDSGAACSGGGGGGGASQQTVAFSATPTFDGGSGTVKSFYITLTGNITSCTLANFTAGQLATFNFIQDGTGTRTAACAGLTGLGTLSGQAGKTDTQQFQATSASAATADSVMTCTGCTPPGISTPSGFLTLPTGPATISATVASGTLALATGAIGSGACTSAQTATATGTLTTDTPLASFNGDPTGVTGYSPSASGGLFFYVYPTANTFNVKVCNNTGGSITPGAITLNWRVVR